MKRLPLLFLALLGSISLRDSASAAPPNILFIFSDDHAQHAISSYGSKVNQTPNIDRLATTGTRFANSFVTNSICTPSRATLLTGQYSHLNGVPVFNRFDGSRDNVAKHLKAGGYYTGVIGKWHLGSDPTGFDRWIVLPGQGAYIDPVFLVPGAKLTIKGHCTDITTDLGLSDLHVHSLRHSYAQRHADAGVPVDVLRELMDHRSVQTTMGYYHISLARKTQAIRRVGSLATDANGDPSPFASPLAYERASVSVPFGNCTEPSNVKAGGGHCPIRFQCAGCGFYRPDPSYLPALEAHVASLRADLETARAISAANYVIANLTAEIDAFGRAAEKMRRRLGELDPDERAEVDEASRILRRARAARRIPVIAAPPQQTR